MAEQTKTNSPQGKQAPPHERHSAVTEEIETLLHVTDEDIADYTEAVVPKDKRRSNFRMLAQFLSMQAVFGAVLVGYGARFQGQSLGQLMVAMTIAAVVMTVYCIGSANAGAVTLGSSVAGVAGNR